VANLQDAQAKELENKKRKKDFFVFCPFSFEVTLKMNLQQQREFKELEQEKEE
jgi:hypothetical protein